MTNELFEVAPEEHWATLDNRLTINDAAIYCKFLGIDGKCDWRLPTAREFNTIKCYHENLIESQSWVSEDIQSHYSRYNEIKLNVIPVRTK